MAWIWRSIDHQLGLIIGASVAVAFMVGYRETPMRPGMAADWTQPASANARQAFSCFSPDGSTLVTDGAEGGWLRDALTGKQLLQLSPAIVNVPFSNYTGLHHIRYSTDSKRLLAQIGGSQYHHNPAGLKVWDLEARKVLLDLPNIGSGEDAWRFTATPDLFVVAAPSSRDDPKIKEMPNPTIKGAPMMTVVTGSGLIGSFDVHDLRTGSISRRLGGLPPIALSPDGSRLACQDTDHRTSQLLVWDVAQREVIGMLVHARGRTPTTLAFSDDGKYLDALGNRWEIESGKAGPSPTQMAPTTNAPTNSPSWSTDRTKVAFIEIQADDFSSQPSISLLKFRDVASGAERTLAEAPGFQSLVLSGDGKAVAVHLSHDESDPWLSTLIRRMPFLERFLGKPQIQHRNHVEVYESSKGRITSSVDLNPSFDATDVRLALSSDARTLLIDGGIFPKIRSDPMLVDLLAPRRVLLFDLSTARNRPARDVQRIGMGIGFMVFGAFLDRWRARRRRSPGEASLAIT